MNNRSIYQAKRQRLAALEERAARYGIDTPAEVLVEIQELRRELWCPMLTHTRAQIDAIPLCILIAVLALVLAVVVLILILIVR